MFGAFIGDIVGSKYEFNNTKDKSFPLFSQGCDFTDDTIMTVAVAKAILQSYNARRKGEEKGFQEFLVEIMQDYGRRYPNPTGAYGGSFAKWLRQKDPKPYGSFGNGSAMRVSPCGLFAVTMEEALELARASACVSHDHPEGVKGAEAVSTAIFLAKCGKSKEEIRQYISEHYYKLDFTLDSIRDSYKFDGSCQGSVPQAIIAFLESESFEDAIRNVISIGGDCDTTGAITGSIAWIYYVGYYERVWDELVTPMQEIKNRAKEYLPDEFIEIEEAFRDLCGKRGSAYNRIGIVGAVVNREERRKYSTEWGKPAVQQNDTPSPITKEIKEAMLELCNKYVVLLEVLYRDKELNQWCRDYSAYQRNTEHCEVEKAIYDGFMREAYAIDMQKVLSWKPFDCYRFESALTGTYEDLIYGICLEIRMDYASNGSLINNAIANGRLFRLIKALFSCSDKPRYTLDYIMAREGSSKEKIPGAFQVRYDQFMKYWHLKIQLDKERLWYLSVFVQDDGSFKNYTLDNEKAEDSHYEFVEEQAIRNSLYVSGDENKYFHEILIQYINKYGAEALRSHIMPYVTKQFHFN